MGELAERLILRLPVARFIAISESTASKLVAHGVDPDRVSVIPCGYDPATVAAIEPEHTDRTRITVVGRAVPYKRLDVVLRAAARLAPEVPDLEVVVIGQGPELDTLGKLATDLGIAHQVDFRGFVDEHRTVLAAVAGSRAFVVGQRDRGLRHRRGRGDGARGALRRHRHPRLPRGHRRWRRRRARAHRATTRPWPTTLRAVLDAGTGS